MDWNNGMGIKLNCNIMKFLSKWQGTTMEYKDKDQISEPFRWYNKLKSKLNELCISTQFWYLAAKHRRAHVNSEQMKSTATGQYGEEEKGASGDCDND